ncbi:glycoside hydrolase family 92 protein [Mucilaginibacter hurinus]|uniref:Glycoside hydrolase family 92 protein n=1 Tax=Mucilaginibacter hurinus TaxID=2201324 RepID=A0A367GNE9_9SPHI|nr:GH92 family glycosyl hydrolase [Mucilaginibacter hurinus]RCH54201.1 glycoside hydrolase family 92 protein [Mucilaginibacter hurinus]
MKKILTFAFSAAVSVTVAQQKPLIDYVNPIIGTGGTAHTYPGPTVPFGMVQPGPDTGFGLWEHCAGYYYNNPTIIGFSNTHISGTGVGDLGDVMLQPATGSVKTERGDEKIPGSGYRSRFSHDDEKASPGYYQVRLLDHNVNVELTATERAGLHKYTFPRNADSSYVILDMGHVVTSEKGKTIWGFIQVVNDSTVLGYRLSKALATERYMYYAIRFSRPFSKFNLMKFQERISVAHPVQGSGDEVKAVFRYTTKHDKPLLVKVGLSAVDADGALANLDAEIPHWNFDKVKKQAEDKWERELSKVTAVKADNKTKTIFYTALYHTMLAPTIYMDADGRYRGVDNKIHQDSNFLNYTLFSLWDTFRAEHPLFTLLYPERVNDMITSMLMHYKQSAYRVLPKWSFHANETWTMIGYHAVPVIADAYLKGFKGFDSELALEAMKASANAPFEGMEYYKTIGYVPIDKEPEAASKTMEYAYDDWTIAAMAKKMGKTDDYNIFLKRSANYKNVYDSKINFARAKLLNGQFKTPFDPLHMRYGGDYTEGNAWQYSWFVPHDIGGLMTLMGGRDKFSAKLDTLLSMKETVNDMSGEQPYDVTGMVGQYAHGNEPSHHIAYLYNYADQPWKTQETVHKIMTRLYNNTPDGLAGNDDCGQMSAWYVWSALGMYPVNPAGGVYSIGTPSLSSATINLQGGKQLVVKANNLSMANRYVRSIKLNGRPYKKTWITHELLYRGGIMEFEMAGKPVKNWFTGNDLEAEKMLNK